MLKSGIPQHDWGKGKIQVAGGTVREKEKGRLIGGIITVYRVPPSVGGALLVTIKDDLIVKKKRVSLNEMRTKKSMPKQNQGYFILSTSPT